MKTNEKDRAEWLEEFPERVTPYNTIPLGQILTYADARDLIADVDDAAELVKALAAWCSDRDRRPNELLDLAAAFLKEPSEGED